MTAPVIPQEFVVNGDLHDYEQPPNAGTDNTLGEEGVTAYVDFMPRLPLGFEAFVANYQVVPGVNAVQQIWIDQTATAGTFTLTLDGHTTSALPYNATAAQIQSALQALSNIGAGNVIVTPMTESVSGDVMPGQFTVTFQGALGNQPVNELTSAGSLTSPAPAVTVTPIRTGVPAVNAQQTVTINGTPTGGWFQLTYAGQTTGLLAYNATALQVQSALQNLSNIGYGGVAVSLSGNVYTIVFTGPLAGHVVSQISASSFLTPSGTTSITTALTVQGVNSVNAEVSVLVTYAVGGTFTLTYAGQTTAPIPYDARPEDIVAALSVLPNVGGGAVEAVVDAVHGVVIMFQNSLGGAPQTLTANASGLLAAGPQANISVVTAGVTPVGRDSGVAIKPVTARFLLGQLQTINVADPPGVSLLCNDPVLGLAGMPELTEPTTDFGNESYLMNGTDLLYDVRFRDVQMAGTSDVLENFAIKAPPGATTIDLMDPTLQRFAYKPAYDWESPYP